MPTPTKRTKVTTLEIRGKAVPISVDERGQFYAEVSDVVFSAEALGKLEDKLINATRTSAVKISLPFARLRLNGRVESGLITGIHGGTGNAIVTWEGRGKKADQERFYDLVRDCVRPLSPTECQEWHRLCDELTKAQQEVAVFRKRHFLNVEQAAKDAVEAALSTKN